jgi:hypothetical protein
MEREKAAICAFITLKEPTRPKIEEAASAGFYEPEHFSGRYPRLQILTIEELLKGRSLNIHGWLQLHSKEPSANKKAKNRSKLNFEKYKKTSLLKEIFCGLLNTYEFIR